MPLPLKHGGESPPPPSAPSTQLPRRSLVKGEGGKSREECSRGVQSRARSTRTQSTAVLITARGAVCVERAVTDMLIITTADQPSTAQNSRRNND